jgi:RNA polymerase sigma factor (sigma-70 family)
MRLRVVTETEQDSSLVELYRREWAPLVRTAVVLVRSRAIAEEIVQDAFVALQSTSTLVANPGGYLRTSVLNACRSAHRHQMVVDKTVLPRQSPVIDQHDELSDALAALPWRQQAALVLRYHLDLPEAQIADALGCRPSTVRSLVKRGLETLRQEIES